MSFLELRNIHKAYKMGKETFPVLKGINLTFDRGEFVSILGESGGGKSTLLNIIGGLDYQYEGDVLLRDQPLRAGSEKAFDAYRSQTVGFIFQNFNLVSHLTNLQNVMVPLEMSSLSHAEQLARAKALLTKVGLQEHMHKYPRQLSGGQKQRVAIARALANDPDIIIADEPTGALDRQNTQEVLALLTEIADEGKLLIVVTHSQTVADYGTRTVHLVDGKIDADTVNVSKTTAKIAERKFSVSKLSFADSFKMAWNHLRYNLGRNLLITFGSAIGIFSVVLMLGLGRGIQNYMNHEISKNINPTTIQVTGRKTDSTPELSKDDFNQLKKVENVTQATPAFLGQGVRINNGEKGVNVQIFQTYNKNELSSTLKHGHKPGTNEVLLSQATAKQLSKHWQSLVGKHVTVYLTAMNAQKQPIQLSQSLTVSGIINSGTDAVSYTTLKDIYKAHDLTLKPNFAAVTINKSQNVKAVEQKINTIKMTKNGKQVNRFRVTGASQVLNAVNTYISLAFYVLTGIAGISLLVSAIMIIVVLYISVSERTREIGILRAIGARRRDIRNMFVSEAFLLGIFSSTLGVLLAYLIQLLVNNGINSITHFAIIGITPGAAIGGIITGTLISLLAAWSPSRRASKLNPIEALSAD
ncbi:ABC transporter ATP-binding protein/permease [Furfurilactobacillus siliginis]|nr:ABC transporter ATP-binding protein/permease [Furfurilactobacillus siliginis]GEK29629.1 ABC transporter ATP-binding protein [Furfurilactobacillus siliginis]